MISKSSFHSSSLISPAPLTWLLIWRMMNLVVTIYEQLLTRERHTCVIKSAEFCRTPSQPSFKRMLLHVAAALCYSVWLMAFGFLTKSRANRNNTAYVYAPHANAHPKAAEVLSIRKCVGTKHFLGTENQQEEHVWVTVLRRHHTEVASSCLFG